MKESTQAALARCGSWSTQTPPSVSGSVTLSAVTTVNVTTAWAVGNYYATNGSIQTLIEYYDGTSWSIISSPNVGSYDNHLYAAAAYNANTVWAVGENWTAQVGNPQALIEFYC